MSKALILYKYGKAHPITFNIGKYSSNGNLHVGMITFEDGYPEPWSNLTVNLGVPCKANCAFIDVNNNGLAIMEWLTDNHLGRILPREIASGFCIYPEFEFDMERLMEYT